MHLSRKESDIGGSAKLLGSARAGSFLVTHKAYTNDFEQSWHEHPVGSIDFVLGGGGDGTYGKRDVQSSPGLVGFFRDGMRHRFRSGATGIRTMHVVIPAEMLNEISGLRDTGVEELEHTRAVGLASRVLVELTQPDRSSGLAMESLAYELLDEVAGVASRPARRAGWIGVVRDYLYEVHDQSVSLDELADAAGVSRGHLARGFRASMWMTIGEYHRRIRISRAAKALAHTNESIARIACGAGFVDQAHFTRAFRSHVGQTPGVFRAVLRG